MKLLILFISFFLQTSPSLEVFPNPGSGQFTVTFKADLQEDLLLAVSDATGKFIYLKTVKDFKGEFKETINLGTQPKGVYLFEVEWEKDRQIKKVILQ